MSIFLNSFMLATSLLSIFYMHTHIDYNYSLLYPIALIWVNVLLNMLSILDKTFFLLKVIY